METVPTLEASYIFTLFYMFYFDNGLYPRRTTAVCSQNDAHRCNEHMWNTRIVHVTLLHFVAIFAKFVTEICHIKFLTVTELSGIALGYGFDDRWFESQQRLGVFLFTTASRLAPGPTQPPIQWVPGALSLVVKWPCCEADPSPQSSAEIKNVWSCTSTCTIRLHCMMLSLKHRDNFTLYLLPKNAMIYPLLCTKFLKSHPPPPNERDRIFFLS
jgi:hypothetical protein